MFTVFVIDDSPENIYFVNTDYFEQTLESRSLRLEDVKSQELSLEQLIRLKDRDYRVFILALKYPFEYLTK